MGAIEELGTFIDSDSTRFAIGTSLFLNAMPDEPNRATAIYETPGFAPAYVFAGDLPAYENPRFQIVCRSTSSATARADVHAAWVGVQKIANEALSGKSWLRCEAVQSPFLLKRDDRGRTYFAFNAQAMRRTTST